MPLTVIRVDGARIWGLSMGHLARAADLAQVIREGAGDVLLAMKNYPDGVDYARSRGLAVELLDPADDGEAHLIGLVRRLRPASLVVDLPRTPYRELFRVCRTLGTRTLVFDIAGGLDGEPDHVVNDAVAPELVRYPDLPPGVSLHLGPAWSVLASLPDASPPEEEVRKVLLTMGGSDPAGLTLKVLETLGDLLARFEATVVLGPLFAHEAQARELASPYASVRVVKAPPDFADLMAGADLVLSAGGRTLYELAALGRPVVVLPTIEHEDAAGRAMVHSARFACVGLWKDGLTPTLVREAVECMLPRERRLETWEAGRALVDGKGLQRIVALLH